MDSKRNKKETKEINMIRYILRHDSLLKLIIEEYMDGKTVKGRPRMEYISQIMKDVHM